MKRHARSLSSALAGAVLLVSVAVGGVAAPAHAALPTTAVLANASGEIENLFLNDPADPWSGGEIVVGGQRITLPRNLLIDLPANRLSLTQVFAQAPASCVAAGESGLAKADTCNVTGAGGFATVTANRTSTGRVIAGDVFIEKGLDVAAGVVTFIDHTDGYYRLNGNPGDPTTGVMVRLNDPTGRHTLQQGAGCAAGSSNCSADPRFALDTDNYINVFSTGYPYCIPSTQPRTFVDTLDLNANGSTTDSLTTSSTAAGTGDKLCPDTNRTSSVAADSRRFAPIQVGDSVSAEGNFETVAGVRFLSAHTSKISVALETRSGPGAPNQPDYMYLDEMVMDAPGFYRERARDLFLGSTTAPDSDVVIWTIHRDATNAPHEFPLGSVLGCDNAAGVNTCTRVLGPHTFRIRHDVDFLKGAKPTLNPCTQINADPRFAGKGICPQNGTVADMFGMMSPLPREVQARTGVEMADLARPGGPLLKAVDVQGAPATHGQYLFPMGVGLGGVELPNFAEIDINLLNNPNNFGGMPWTLDRRLSPTGCLPTGCEATPQRLDPYPFEGIDPRTPGAGTPSGTYADPTYTASPLTNERNRMLSYVDATLGNFDGDHTVLAWPPPNPPAQVVLPTPPLNGTNVPPIAKADTATVPTGTTQVVSVLANDLPVDDPIDVTSVAVVTAPSHGTATPQPDGTVSYTPDVGYVGPDIFAYTVQDLVGATSNVATVALTVAPPLGPPPTVEAFSPASGVAGDTVTVTGTNLDSVTAVGFGGVQQPVVVSQTPTEVVVTVPSGAVTGPVTVTSPNGSAASATDFTVVPSVPSVTGLAPAAGVPGDTVVVTGTQLTGATSVSFGGVAQPVLTVDSATQVTTTVPPLAVTGPVTVTTPGGTSPASAAVFTVGTLHAVTGLLPSRGLIGTQVTILGSGLNGLKAGDVTFTGPTARVPAQFVAVDAGRVVAVVPPGAVTGPVSVSTGGNLATSRTDFTVDPTPGTGGTGGTGGTTTPPPAGTPAPVVVSSPLPTTPSVPVLLAAPPTLSVPRLPVPAGAAAVLSGTAPAGSTVTLLAKGAGATSFRAVRTVVAGPDGRYAVSVALLRSSSVYVQVAGGAASTASSVQVRATVTLRARRASARLVRVTGAVAPHRAGVVVAVYRRTSGGSALLGRTRTGADGTFALTAPVRGAATLVAVTRADAANTSGRSPARAVGG